MYNRRILISEDDRNRILNMHKNYATKNGLNFGRINEDVTSEEITVTAPKDVKGFQDWLDQNYKGWVKTDTGTLDQRLNKGYGKYGPQTTNAWNQYSKRYIDEKGGGEVVKLPKKEVLPNTTNSTDVGGVEGFFNAFKDWYKNSDPNNPSFANAEFSEIQQVPGGQIILTSDNDVSQETGQVAKVTSYIVNNAEPTRAYTNDGNSYKFVIKDGKMYGTDFNYNWGEVLKDMGKIKEIPLSPSDVITNKPEQQTTQNNTSDNQGLAKTLGIASTMVMDACKTKFPNIDAFKGTNIAARICTWGDTPDGKYILGLKPEQREGGMDLLEKRGNKNNPETRALKKEIRIALGMAADTKLGQFGAKVNQFGQRLQNAAQGAAQGFQQPPTA